MSRFLLVALAGAGALLAFSLAQDSREDPVPAPGSAQSGWAALRPSPLRRTEVGAARIGPHVYVVGGFVADGGATGRMVRYKIDADVWTELAPLPIEVHHPGVAALGGALYVHGGLRGDTPRKRPSKRLYRYEPARDSWTRLADARVRRLAIGLVGLGGRLYAAGGTNERADLRTVEVYDPGRDRWSSAPPLRLGRHHVGATALGGSIYVLGGRADGEGLTVAERYDPRRRRGWQGLPELSLPRSGFAAVTAGGGIVVFGGEELGPGGETIAPVERYDPERGRWSPLPSMSTPRHGLGGAARGGRIYALEGGPQPGLSFAGANEVLDLPD